jgi:hypothetical protein
VSIPSGRFGIYPEVRPFSEYGRKVAEEFDDRESAFAIPAISV